MKGHVEIFTEVNGEKVVLHEDSNLIVDGAGEAIVDMLTYTPGIALSSNEESTSNNVVAERALDTSNFIIQGMTFGKGLTGYKTNLHTYKRHNLIASANDLVGITPGYRSGVTIEQLPGDHIYDFSSNVFFASSTDGANGGYFAFGSNVFDQGYIDLLSGLPKVFSIDVKLDLNNSPNPRGSTDDGPQFVPVSFDISSGGERSFCTALFATEYRAVTIGGVEYKAGDLISFYNEGIRGGARAYPNALFKDLGAGWKRIMFVIPEATTYDSTKDFQIKVFPVGSVELESTDLGGGFKSIVGGMLFARPSLNVGSLPINYFLPKESVTTSSTDFSAFQFTPSSIVLKEDGYYLPNNTGTVTNASLGYNVSASLPAMPHPNDTSLEPNTSTAYQDSVDVSGLYNGHNLNTLQLVGKTVKKITDFVPSSWSIGGLQSNIDDIEIQKDFRWFGCFADEANDPAYLVSSIDQQAYENPLRNRTSSGDRFNSVSSMDYNGFLRAYYYNTGEGTDNNSKLLVSSLSDFSSTGRVTYSVKINRTDVEMANYFGGIFDLGLYTMDPNATRVKNGIDLSRSIDKDPWTGDDMEFRLFAQKSMNYDITHGNGFNSKDSITINWTIDFI